MSGMIDVEMRSGDQSYVKHIKPVTRFWIPEGTGSEHGDTEYECVLLWDICLSNCSMVTSACILVLSLSLSTDVAYSIQNVDRVPAELVYVRLRQR